MLQNAWKDVVAHEILSLASNYQQLYATLPTQFITSLPTTYLTHVSALIHEVIMRVAHEFLMSQPHPVGCLTLLNSAYYEDLRRA